MAELLDTCRNERHEPASVTRTENTGTPFPVHIAKNLGNFLSNANPYSVRLAQKKKLFPAEKTLVKTNALTICGKTGMCIRSIAMTYGEDPAPGLASEIALSRFGSEYGTTMPTQRAPATKKVVRRQNTVRKAEGSDVRGISASPAVSATYSGPSKVGQWLGSQTIGTSNRYLPK